MSTDKSTKHRLSFFSLDFNTSTFGRKVTHWLFGNITPNMIPYGRRTTDGRRTPSDGNTSHGPLGQVS